MSGRFHVSLYRKLHVIIKYNRIEGKEVLEIERKYLLKDSILSLIKKHTLAKHKIIQFYTTITPVHGIRYRKMDDRYFKTIKNGSGASREEEETETTKNIFKQKMKKRIQDPIKKDRYMFDFEGKTYSIDVFKKNLKGLYILEIEFPDMQEFDQFTLPKILAEHLIKDVSFDEAYKNKNMVLYGKPQTTDTRDTIFTELDTKSIKELDTYFIPELSPLDALEVILYKFSCSILLYKERMILNDNAEDLHQFRVNIRKSRAFLNEFSFLFPKEQQIHFNDNLASFATKTNRKRDLDVIKERLLEYNKPLKMLQKDIQDQRTQEYHKIQKMLKSKTFKHFFSTYQSTLKNRTDLTSEYLTGSIQTTAKKVIQSRYSKIIKKIDALEKEFDEKKLHKIRIAFKKLRYLLEEFQHIFGEEKIEKIIKDGKQLQTLLGDFNDTVNQKTLLHDYFKANKKKISHNHKLEHSLLDQTSKIEKKLMKKAQKKLAQFKKKPFTL